MSLPIISNYNRYVLVEAKLVQNQRGRNFTRGQIEIERNFNSSNTNLKPILANNLKVDTECIANQKNCNHFTLFYIPQLGIDRTQITFHLSILNLTADLGVESLEIKIKTE